MENKAEIFRNAARFLGVRGADALEELVPLLERAYVELERYAAPKQMLRRFAARVENGALCVDTLPPVQSRDLCRLFADAKEGIALLVTLGGELDLRIKRLMLMEPALGAALGACSSAAVDTWIDALLKGERVELEARGLTLSPRFSPGYGDVGLEFQRPLLDWLEARRIGVRLTQGMLMLPEKSVSALIAIKPMLREK
ncbi:MAG: hypothetical protein RR065_10990 [Clostridia bacterium]